MSSRIRYFRTENPNKLVSKPIIIGPTSYVVNLDLDKIGFQLVNYDNGSIVQEGTFVNMIKVKSHVKDLLIGMGKVFQPEVRRNKVEKEAFAKL